MLSYRKFSSGKCKSNKVREMSFEIEICWKKFMDIWLEHEIDYWFIDLKSIQLEQRCVRVFKSSSICNFFWLLESSLNSFLFIFTRLKSCFFLWVKNGKGANVWIKRMDTNFIKDVLSIGQLKIFRLCSVSIVQFCFVRFRSLSNFSWTLLLSKNVLALALALSHFLLFFEQCKYLILLDGPSSVFRIFMKLIKNGLFHRNNATFGMALFRCHSIFDVMALCVCGLGEILVCILWSILLQNKVKCQKPKRLVCCSNTLISLNAKLDYARDSSVYFVLQPKLVFRDEFMCSHTTGVYMYVEF